MSQINEGNLNLGRRCACSLSSTTWSRYFPKPNLLITTHPVEYSRFFFCWQGVLFIYITLGADAHGELNLSTNKVVIIL